jgi:hypothetical protein
MITFQHSGALGDIIWALPVIKHFGGGELNLIPNNISTVLRKYGNGPVNGYENRLSLKDFEMISPLIAAQDYIKSVSFSAEITADYDLDRFRGTVGQAFTKNFINTYAETFGIVLDDGAWLTVPNPKRIAPIVVTRTARYHSPQATTIPIWIRLLKDNDIEQNGVFVGLPEEHHAFEKLFNVALRYHPIKNFLELAEVISGADAYMGNQTFAYSVARGLDKRTILEYRSVDCYIEKEKCKYF